MLVEYSELVFSQYKFSGALMVITKALTKVWLNPLAKCGIESQSTMQTNLDRECRDCPSDRIRLPGTRSRVDSEIWVLVSKSFYIWLWFLQIHFCLVFIITENFLFGKLISNKLYYAKLD
jgi:hypothetical protein